ncbi:carbohydrate ABC transporter permease [Vallitalea okinawensis]|uniref:carbohydrate ABC transporter permease n=1 Tax=Vallitalea okinawensis TaxID=2078660 RepID=UPI000CFB410B|nr:carbohydrate ABC transporter permease [Vallitalea okinawensis]
MKKKRSFNSESFGDRLLMAIIYISLTLVLVMTFYPFFYSIVLSFNESVDTMKGGVYFFPRAFTLDNYIYFFKDGGLLNSIWISVARTVVGTVTGVMFTAAVAYALSFKHLMFKKVYMILIIISMYFSGGLIPYFFTLKQLGLINSFWVYIIPALMNSFFVLIAISFFSDLPFSLYESAKIDGAKDLKIFIKIILPISKPLLATLGLFIAVGQWNNWMDVVFFVQDKDLKTLSYMMIDLINSSQTPMQVSAQSAMAMANNIPPFTLQITAMVIAVFPIAILYPFVQKHFVQGVTIGAVKG